MSGPVGKASSRAVRLLLAAVTVAAFSLSVAITASAQDMPTVTLMPSSDYGMLLTDPSGFTLYTWDGDQPEMSNCWDACSEAWPPYMTESDLIAPDGLPGTLGYIDRGDGTWQVGLDGWPLYYFVRDMNPGDVNGQGSMGFGAAWWAIAFAPSAPIAAPVIPVPPIAQPPAPMPPVIDTSVPPVVAMPEAPSGEPMPPMMGDMGPGMFPPPPLGGQIPPGYLPTLNVVVPPNGTVGLSWLPTPNAQMYRIYETNSAQPLNFTVAQTVNQSLGMLATNAVVAGLNPGASYMFQVRAVDPAGNEMPAPATAMVGGVPSAGLPGLGIGQPTNLSIASSTPTSVTLNWVPIPGIRSYTILQSTNPGGPFVPANMTQANQNGAMVVGLQPNATYFFQLVAIDTLGNSSPASGTVTLATASTAASTSTSIGVSGLTSSTAQLTWAIIPGATTYQILQSMSPAGPFAPAAVANPSPGGATVTGLNPSTTYFFQVVAIDANGMQIMATAPASGSTLSIAGAGPQSGAILPPPSAVQVSSTTGQTVTLSWTPTPGAVSYAILQSSNGVGPFQSTNLSGVSGTSVTISGLNPSTTYFFQVVALDLAGHQSSPSSVATARTTSSLAGVP